MSVYLPLAPLLAVAPDSTFTTPTGTTFPTGKRVTSLARIVGVNPRTVHTWAHDGIPLHSADRAAIALDRHPCEVWPDWWAINEEHDGWAEVERSWRQWHEQGLR